MCHLDGILFRILTSSSLALFTLVLFLMIWHTDRGSKIVVIGLGALTILSYGYYTYKYFNPDIRTFEGYFVEEKRANDLTILTDMYTFSDGTRPKPVFELDFYTKKKFFPEEFQKDTLYRIYYENGTDIILGVETLEPAQPAQGP